MAARLSTTSYAVLSLLAVQPFTTYELTKQMDRVLREIWPRAESVIYEEPKRLVAHGLARARTEYTGKRASTVYAITRKGRRTLRRWLGEPGGGPVIEFEAMLQVAFADHGDRDQLAATIDAIATEADERMANVRTRLAEYRETGGPFPERLPVIALVARFHQEQAEALSRWATWAAAEVEGWTGVTVADGARIPPAAFDDP